MNALCHPGWQVHLISRARHQTATTRQGEAAGSISSQHGIQHPSAAIPPAAGGGGAAGQATKAAQQQHRIGGLEDGVIICGGDFVRLSHQEIIGHLIARGTYKGSQGREVLT